MDLTEDVLRAVDAFRAGRAVAWFNDPTAARQIATGASRELSTELVIRQIHRRTNMRVLVGDPREPVSAELSPVHAASRQGGLVLLEVTEPVKPVVDALELLTPLLPSGRRPWRFPDYQRFSHVDVHPHFHLALSFPALRAEIALTPSLTTRLVCIDLATKAASSANNPVAVLDLGPGQVLVLMRFGVAAHEAWFRDVIAPSVEPFGTCVRMTMPLDDWQSDVHRAIERADAVIMELSQAESDISRNVLWEVNQMWSAFIAVAGAARSKMLFMARGLEHVRSVNPRRGFVYSSEVGPEWIANMPKSARSWEDLQGFPIRRYDPENPESREEVTAWLRDRLAALVQSIPARVNDADVVARAEALLALAAPNEEAWIRAIVARNFDECGALLRDGALPDGVQALMGDLLATVSASQAIQISDYWPLAEAAARRSSLLRAYYLDLLGTPQMMVDDGSVQHFHENAWHAFHALESSLTAEEMTRLVELSSRQQRRWVRIVSDHFRRKALSQNAVLEVRRALLDRAAVLGRDEHLSPQQQDSWMSKISMHFDRAIVPEVGLLPETQQRDALDRLLFKYIHVGDPVTE